MFICLTYLNFLGLIIQIGLNISRFLTSLNEHVPIFVQ